MILRGEAIWTSSRLQAGRHLYRIKTGNMQSY